MAVEVVHNSPAGESAQGILSTAINLRVHSNSPNPHIHSYMALKHNFHTADNIIFPVASTFGMTNTLLKIPTNDGGWFWFT